MIKAAVTIGKGSAPSLTGEALSWSKRFGLPYIERTRGTLLEILAEQGLDALLLATARGPELHSLGGRLFFHPGMGLLRIKNIMAGKGDRLIDALGLQEGMRTLDCSFGLGSDAAVASFAVGGKGKVVALEASPLVAFVMQEGMKRYCNGILDEALLRIELINREAMAYLSEQPDNAFDTVYFDPMFGYEVAKSSNMRPLRPLAHHGAFGEDFLAQAKRVAAQRVVIKVAEGSRLAEKFALEITADGKYSKVKYAVIEVAK